MLIEIRDDIKNNKNYKNDNNDNNDDNDDNDDNDNNYNNDDECLPWEEEGKMVGELQGAPEC